MEITVSRVELSRALSSVTKVIESRNTIPILGYVRLVAENGKLAVTGTDMDIVAIDKAPAAIATPGAVCVDAKLFSDITKKSGNDEIKIALLDDGKLEVKSGRSRFALATLPAGDFPDFTDGQFAAEFEADLSAMFAPVTYAISTEEARYFLNGVYFAGLDGSSVACATDGHRLSKVTGPDLGVFPGVIVPRKAVSVMPKGGAKVSVSETKIRFVAGDATITSKLIDGTFPDFERVIPSENPIGFSIGRDEFMQASERVVTVSSDKGKGVKVSIAPGSVMLSARSEVGNAEDEVACDYTGKPAEVGYNSAYLRDMLSALPQGSTVMCELQEGGPGVFKSSTLTEWTGVLMPMRV
jgi:DNA polymerase III subunit beta